MCNLLAKNGQKFVVLWSFEANHDSKLTLTAGKTVYGVESVDEVFLLLFIIIPFFVSFQLYPSVNTNKKSPFSSPFFPLFLPFSYPSFPLGMDQSKRSKGRSRKSSLQISPIGG